MSSKGWAQGAIQRVDATEREIEVMLATGLELFFVPPDSPIFLHGERIKLRLIQPRDQARISFLERDGLLVVKQLELQPDSNSESSPN